MRSVDEITAAELLDGLPSRVHEVYAPFVRDIPDHPAFVEGGRSWSYRQFSEAVDAAAKDLSDLGIRPGDRVMIASENSVALGAMLFAASKLDAWGIAVNPRLSAREIDLIGTHSGAQTRAVQLGAFEGSGRSRQPRRRQNRRCGTVRWNRYWSTQCGCASGARREGWRPPGRWPLVHLGHDRCSEGSHAEPPQPALYRKDFGNSSPKRSGRPHLRRAADVPHRRVFDPADRHADARRLPCTLWPRPIPPRWPMP